jgi:hypothetical protein
MDGSTAEVVAVATPAAVVVETQECITKEAVAQGLVALWLTLAITALFMFRSDRSYLSLFMQVLLTSIAVWSTGCYCMAQYRSSCTSVVGVLLVLFVIVLVIWTIRQICDSRKCCGKRVVRCD